MEGYYTLITGAGSGIGRAMAFECARRNNNLVLVSRPSERLEKTAADIAAQFNVDVKKLAIDLCDPDAAEKVFDWCRVNGLKINFLINNAGIIGTFIFESADIKYLNNMIILNMLTLTKLIHCFLHEMKTFPVSRILNIGSMSGYFPIPYKGVYAASKAYVYSLSRSLETELRGSGVELFLVSPNGIDSNPGTVERIKKHKRIGKLVSMNTELFCKLTLDKVEGGKKFFIPLFSNRLLFGISRLLPDRVITALLKYEFQKEIKD